MFFFDEAHLLFNDAPKALLDKIEQVVRLIRSKGVGVYFVTQNPLDVPDKVLAQLGNRVQHALRAFTPRDQKAVRAAAETFRPNPKLDTAGVITQLGKGEALVSFLEGNGTPSMVERALIRPPSARVGPVTAEERKAIIAKSPLQGPIRHSDRSGVGFEILQKRPGGTAPDAGAPGARRAAAFWAGSAACSAAFCGGGARGAPRPHDHHRGRGQAGGAHGRRRHEVGRAIVRGVLGSLGGKR